MGGFDLKADPVALQNVGKVIGEDAISLRTEAGKLGSIVENLRSIWQDEANTVYVNDATEYLEVLKAIIDAIENHGTYLVETGSGIGSVVAELKSGMQRL